MTDLPLVSIVIIFLNQEKFLQETLDSVFNQSYQNWELLLVDDGSSDKSSKIAAGLAQKNPGKIYYLEHDGHKNRGQAISRNLGIAHAKGELIALLDGDDIWLPDKLQEQVRLMQEYPQAAALYGRTMYWFNWPGNSNNGSADYITEVDGGDVQLIQPPQLLPELVSQKKCPPLMSNIMLRRTTVQKIKGFAVDSPRLFEDQMFFIKLAANLPILVANRHWDNYRQHSASICSVSKKTGEIEMVRANLNYLDWIADYLASENINDKKVWRILRKQLWLYKHYRQLLDAKELEKKLNKLRWLKKWWLKIDNRFLPETLQNWLWTGTQDGQKSSISQPEISEVKHKSKHEIM